MKRRQLLLGVGAAAGALVVGWGLMPVRQRQLPRQALPTSAGQAAFGGWLKLGADAVAFRLALLKKHRRHAAVLLRVATLGAWGSPPAAAADGAQVARGVALHQSFGSIVAQVAEVSLNPDRAAPQALRVHRVFCVIDCGVPVNPNLIRQQMDSGIVFGLTAALYGGITVEKGRVQQGNFHKMGMLRMADGPVVVTEIMPSAEHPEGVGEPGTPPIAPARGQRALTQQRLRSLPLAASSKAA